VKANSLVFVTFRKSEGSLIDIRPNTVSFTFAIQGWAKGEHTNKAEELLEKHLDACLTRGDKRLQPDQVLFHAVLEAYAIRGEKYVCFIKSNVGDTTHGRCRRQVGGRRKSPQHGTFAAHYNDLVRGSRNVD
jgi:hypothetical protein